MWNLASYPPAWKTPPYSTADKPPTSHSTLLGRNLRCPRIQHSSSVLIPEPLGLRGDHIAINLTGKIELILNLPRLTADQAIYVPWSAIYVPWSGHIRTVIRPYTYRDPGFPIFVYISHIRSVLRWFTAYQVCDYISNLTFRWSTIACRSVAYKYIIVLLLYTQVQVISLCRNKILCVLLL